MTQQEFVEAIQTLVMQASVDGSVALMRDPPGRRPSARLRRMHEWYETLMESDRAFVRAAMQLVAHGAVHGFLCVLDGNKVIEDLGPKGSFELSYVSPSGERTAVAGASQLPLHELLDSSAIHGDM